MGDEEIEAIKRRKMEKLLKRAQGAQGIEPAIDAPITLTDATLPRAIAEHRVLVVDCWARWCAPCRRLAPVVDALAKQYAGRVVFGKVDVDKNPLTVRMYAIGSIPTLLFFKEGRLVGKKVGALPQPLLVEAVEALL
ncbi:thioredoxin domain-containing protein [Methermicoccus shengliensis]|uniref:Thiol reductase thioredoxin n=1 Tax=Methermicoccus shengliensis TaxID=660064 RepID=A0A832VMP5_9EURY|nr:thioredoxin domain-containing protein [Methermicoccus shengliensis]KUK04182.1 MAG: Thioredoxin [Euryarchaeota archaeon 55_53]KUK29893.1 MAG: Thioredoxin [Methanosarcinales archeaon 56_1174]MDI3488371.1 thioredoxin 1 [Methanosarcinales archaeon]MDN5295846.1 thioredoxin 1 [Methanosarcinales archaeon]HIH69496.1 thiol reductase thioredoxin [Methermicoccus shengliensis]